MVGGEGPLKESVRKILKISWRATLKIQQLIAKSNDDNYLGGPSKYKILVWRNHEIFTMKNLHQRVKFNDISAFHYQLGITLQEIIQIQSSLLLSRYSDNFFPALTTSLRIPDIEGGKALSTAFGKSSVYYDLQELPSKFEIICDKIEKIWIRLFPWYFKKDFSIIFCGRFLKLCLVSMIDMYVPQVHKDTQ